MHVKNRLVGLCEVLEFDCIASCNRGSAVSLCTRGLHSRLGALRGLTLDVKFQVKSRASFKEKHLTCRRIVPNHSKKATEVLH